jgi:hypothetical protein
MEEIKDLKLKIESDKNISQEQSPVSVDEVKNTLTDRDEHDIKKAFAKLGVEDWVHPKEKERRVLVIPIGFPNAGKSLWLSSLMYYAIKGKDRKSKDGEEEGYDNSFSVTVESKYPYDSGRTAFDKMRDDFGRGKLYDVTQMGTMDLIGINMKPQRNGIPPLRLAFLDLAGEDIKKIKHNLGAAFTDKINAVFDGVKMPKSPVIFALIVPFEPSQEERIEPNGKKVKESLQDAHDRDDALHYDFLNYLKTSQKWVLNNARIFVIVSKWDKNEYDDDYEDGYEREKAVIEFIKEKRPSIYNFVKDDPNVVWGSYSVGDVIVSQRGGVTIQEIDNTRFDYPSGFWKSLYKVCTGKDLVKIPWWRKLFG